MASNSVRKAPRSGSVCFPNSYLRRKGAPWAVGVGSEARHAVARSHGAEPGHAVPGVSKSARQAALIMKLRLPSRCC